MGFPGPDPNLHLALCHKWMAGLGWDWEWDLCAGLLYEHRFAMLIIGARNDFSLVALVTKCKTLTQRAATCHKM